MEKDGIIVKDNIGSIIGDHNVQNINIILNRTNENDNMGKIKDVRVSALIMFAKNHYAKVSWGKIFSNRDNTGRYPNAGEVIDALFSKAKKEEYVTIFGTIKKMYSNLFGKELEELKKIINQFDDVDYDLL